MVKVIRIFFTISQDIARMKLFSVYITPVFESLFIYPSLRRYYTDGTAYSSETVKITMVTTITWKP